MRFPVADGTPLPLAAARNAGIAAAADADLVVLLDVDCVPEPQLVGALVDATTRTEGAALLAGPVGRLSPLADTVTELGAGALKASRAAARAGPRPVPVDGELVPEPRHELFWSLSFAVTPRTHAEIGGFDEGYAGYGAEDTDYAFRARAAGVDLVWVGGAWAHHQHHPVSDPPREHLREIVPNARRFRARWGVWPMVGWLRAFAASGAVDWDERGDRLVIVDRMGGDVLATELHARRLRATPQRRAILEAFEGGADEHLSAEEIHARASARVPGIGRGTVYATLAELAESGLLASVGSQEPIRYETNVSRHDHFRCRRCLRTFDIALRAPATAELVRGGYVVERMAVLVEGLCAACQDYVRGLQDGAAAVTRERLVDPGALDGLACARHTSRVGPLLVCATSEGVARVAFEGHADFGPFADRARSRRGGRAARDRVDACVESIDAFLGGERAQSDVGVDWSITPDAGRDVLEATRRIPWGERRSYHLLEGGISPYDSGFAMGTNPLPFLFPCHRVTQGQHVLDTYVGGSEVRDKLDELEHPN